MSYFEFYNPTKILSGSHALENLPNELTLLGAHRPIVLTDPGIRDAGLLKHVLHAIDDSTVTIAAIYDTIPQDSSLKVVQELALIYRQNRCDSIVAVGGGSVIDTAKGLNILISEASDQMDRFTGAEMLENEMAPMVVIPTTAGTGSEVTLAAVIADTDRHLKLAFTSYRLIPHVAILDPRMTLTLPPHLTAATAMDAMAHAVEAYTGLQKNPLSDAYAFAAIRDIAENLLPVVQNGKDPQGRLKLAAAACFAGIAFSNSMVGAVHSLGHAAGGICGIPHGTAMNIFLPFVLEYNRPAVEELIAELLLPLAGATKYAETPAEKRADEAIKTIRFFKEDLNKIAGLPRTLREAGVKQDKLEAIASASLGDGSLMYNPVEMDLEDAMAILKRAYNGQD